MGSRQDPMHRWTLIHRTTVRQLREQSLLTAALVGWAVEV